MATGKGPIRLTPLGGVGEIGKNCHLVEYQDHYLVIDAGVLFPPEELHGVDLVIPDFSYLLKRADRLEAILITHAHEDHVGALPYLLKQLNRKVRIYSLPLTIGLLGSKLREHDVLHLADLVAVSGEDCLDLDPFQVEFIPISHSVPDSAAILVRTPTGNVFFTGDFKFDETPPEGQPPDMNRLRALGDEGILVLLSDCVRVERPGVTPSERVVAEALSGIVAEAPGRVILTTFASNIVRLQQAIATAHRFGRRVSLVGRSIEGNFAVAQSLGYLDVPDDTVVSLDQLKRLPLNQAMILTTGSQGEPTAVLSRIAMGDHRQLRVIPGDTVVLSASPIPGNEETVSRTIDNLMRRGARVLYPPVVPDIHVSGHASREELRALLQLLRPTYAVPVHGEYRQMVHYKELAEATGVPADRVKFVELGKQLAVTPGQATLTNGIPAGDVLVDGLTVGGVNQIVLRDRHHLASDGVVIAAVALSKDTGELLSGPDVTARGFIAPPESTVLNRGSDRIRRYLRKRPSGEVEYAFLAGKIKDVLGSVIYEQTRLRPMILPVIAEV